MSGFPVDLSEKTQTDFWGDFSRAQSSMPACPLDSVNPHFKSKFASLSAVTKVAQHFIHLGFAITQSINTDERGVCAVTIIRKGVERFASESPYFPVTKHDAQGYASACTYARRIGLATALGIVGQEDDDGNAAIGEVPAAPKEAIAAAKAGKESFRGYWSGLSAAQRADLKPNLGMLKQLAEKS